MFTPVHVKAMVPPVQKVNAANIPLVNVGDRLAGASAVAFIGIDDYGIALETARTLLKAMGGKGNVLVLEGPDTILRRPPGCAVSRMRRRSSRASRSSCRRTRGMPARWPPTCSRPMLKVNPPPQADGILAANDAMAFGALEAFKEAKMNHPLIVGINASKEAVEFIKAGDMLASGDYNGLSRAASAPRSRFARCASSRCPRGVAKLRGRQEQLPGLRGPGRKAAVPDPGKHGGEVTYNWARDRAPGRLRVGHRACGRVEWPKCLSSLPQIVK